MDLVRSQIEDLTIEDNTAVGACRRKATQFAEQLGFDSVKVEEIAISVTELVMNVLIHGGGKGHFVICRIQNGHTHNGLEIWCCDYGNGISDPLQAALVRVAKPGWSRAHNSRRPQYQHPARR